MIGLNYKKAVFGLILSGFAFANAMHPEKHGEARPGTVRVRFKVDNISSKDFTIQGWKEKVGNEKKRKSILGTPKAFFKVLVGKKDAGFHLAMGKETDAPQFQTKQILEISQGDSSPNVYTVVNEVKLVEGKSNEYIYTGTLSDGKDTKTITRTVEKPAGTAGDVRVKLILGDSLETSSIQ